MEDKETVIKKATTKAEKEAKKQGLNEIQSKLYVDEEVKKTVDEYEKTSTSSKTKATKKVENSEDTEKIYIVKTPVQNFNGEVAGVQFAYGKARVKAGWILDWFKEHGYSIEEE